MRHPEVYLGVTSASDYLIEPEGLTGSTVVMGFSGLRCFGDDVA